MGVAAVSEFLADRLYDELRDLTTTERALFLLGWIEGVLDGLETDAHKVIEIQHALSMRNLLEDVEP